MVVWAPTSVPIIGTGRARGRFHIARMVRARIAGGGTLSLDLMGRGGRDFEPLGESDLPQAGIVVGALGALGACSVWVYLAYLVLTNAEESSGIAYRIKVLGGLGLLAGLPSAAALVVGLACALRPRASRPFRRRGVVAAVLGALGLFGAAAIQLMADAAVRSR